MYSRFQVCYEGSADHIAKNLYINSIIKYFSLFRLKCEQCIGRLNVPAHELTIELPHISRDAFIFAQHPIINIVCIAVKFPNTLSSLIIVS